MNVWLWASTVFTTVMLICGVLCLRGSLEDRVAAMQLASVAGVLALLTAGQGYGPAFYADLAIVLTVLSLGGAFAFARCMERWL